MMTANDFRRLALLLEGAEEGIAHGSTRLSRRRQNIRHPGPQHQGYGNLMLSSEEQQTFVEEQPDVFLPVPGGWGRMGATHIRLAAASEDLLAGALRTAWKLRLEKNAKAKGKSAATKKTKTAGRRHHTGKEP